MKSFYIVGVITISIFIIVIYLLSRRDHQKEIAKIEMLELKYKEEKEELDKIRQKTKPCTETGLTTPRSCYFQSMYKCSWNEDAKRCDQR